MRLMTVTDLPMIEESLTNALRRARSVLNFLAELHIPPTPARFTVAYAHQMGDISDLSLAMNRLISHDRLTAKAIDELFQQFFASEPDRAELTYASRKVADTVTDVSEQISGSRQLFAGYGEKLHYFSRLLEDGDLTQSQSLTSDMLASTSTIAAGQRQLSDRLDFALRELETLRKHLDRLERDSQKDSLTGIGNRGFFNRELRAAMARAKREAEPLTLLMIDIDHFKQFNDRYGHQMGDQVLKLVARQLNSIARDGNEPARYGGEEFVLILRNCDLGMAVEIADRLRMLVAGKKVVNRRSGEVLGQVTLSIGVALYRNGENAAEFVHRADEAMYLAKANGRNCVVTEDHAGMSV